MKLSGKITTATIVNSEIGKAVLLYLTEAVADAAVNYVVNPPKLKR